MPFGQDIKCWVKEERN